MTRKDLRALVGMDADRVEEAITELLNERKAAQDNAIEAATKPLQTQIAKLEADVKAADDEVAKITEQFGEKNSDTWEAKAKEWEGKYNSEAEAHRTYRTEIDTAKTREAQGKAFLDAVTAFEGKDKAKLNPKQAAVFAELYGKKAEFAEKGGVYTVKNLDAIMAEGMTNEAFEFKPLTTQVVSPGSFRNSTNTVPNFEGGANINSGMNALIRGAGQPAND